MVYRFASVALIAILSASSSTMAGEPLDKEAAARGKKALLTRAFSPKTWTTNAYEQVWKYWDDGLKAPPKDYQQAFMQRYGLHPAPYENGSYPMGLREASNLFGKGLTNDCLMCHGGAIMGKSYVGLGNSSLDIQTLFTELGKASGSGGNLPFAFSNVRGTTEAGPIAIYLLSFRQPNLNLRLKPLELDMEYTLCEDVPAWWLLKKKKTMYHTGSTPAKSVRSIMQFMLGSPQGRALFDREEKTFADIQAYILSLEPPEYPFAIDEKLASAGKKVFAKNCSTCHGTYGKDWTYPNKDVPLHIIGTDKTRYFGISDKWGLYYNKTWFAQKEFGGKGKAYPVRKTKGYQAPPLDGIWATAPYLHNGSVPTVYHLLNSKTRPKIFTRSYRTDQGAYDKENLGWKVEVLDQVPSKDLPSHERLKIYDTTQPGRGNGGHLFGDDLTGAQRRAVIEYLKTL